MKVSRIAVAVLVGGSLLVPAATSSAAPAESGFRAAAVASDVVTVSQALVNKLGGVSVAGWMSCAASAAAIRAGQFVAEDFSTGQWVIVPVVEGEELILLTNPDQYTVSQPAGRKTMIQVSHQSSRAHPCYTDTDHWTDGTPITCAVHAVCPWRTDQFGWAGPAPLFDYSPNGKFKTGALNVKGYSSGLWVSVIHDDGTSSDYGAPESFFMPYDAVLRAVASR